MDDNQMLRIVERYVRKGSVEEGEIKVTRIPDRKTVFVEQLGQSGRAIVLNEYKVDNAIYWAGYNSISQTVYISYAA
jgi:hypothetical protein